MECISISFKTAPANIRKLFSCIKHVDLHKYVILNTCNRMELYAEETMISEMENVLLDATGLEITVLRKYARYYKDKKAAEHLFKVSCGLESMVLGENEILGQVRDSYCSAYNEGHTGYEIDTVFRASLACAKRIKTETEISKSALSIATLACNEAVNFAENIDKPYILLIGASGKTGNSVLKNLISKANFTITVTKRVHGIGLNNVSLCNEIDYSQRYKELDNADIIISVTDSPHYTITAADAKQAINTKKKRLFIDLAIPADIDDSIAELENCRLISIDNFENIAYHNNKRKLQAAEEAQIFINEDLQQLYKKMSFHKSIKNLDDWNRVYDEYSFEKLLFLLRDNLDAKSFEAVLNVLKERIK